MDKLIGDLAGLFSDLENLYPVEMRQCRSLVALEIEEDDELSLSSLQDAASGTDDLLSEVVADKTKIIAARNEAKGVLAEGTARVKVGNHWGESVLTRGAPAMDKTENKAVTITASGGAIVHIGSSLGGYSIFDWL